MTLRDGWPAVSNAADQFDIRAALRVDTAQDVSGNIKTGVAVNAKSLSGLVTARSDMRVDVAAFAATLDRQGPVKLYNDGTVTVQLDAAPSANSRIDTVYVKQNEASSPISDSSDGPIFGKVTGVAGTSPVAPSIPAGAMRLADITVPSTATSTASSGVTIVQQYPFTASAGGWLQFRNTADMTTWNASDGYRARLLDGTQYKRAGGAWLLSSSKNVTQNGFYYFAADGVVIVGVDGAKTGSGYWDTVNAPFTIPADLCPSRTVYASCLVANGASSTKRLAVTSGGTVTLANMGGAGSGDACYGSVSYPVA